MEEKYYWSRSAQGFFTTSMNGDNMPNDRYELTKEEYDALRKGLSEGKTIDMSKNEPVLIDMPPPSGEEAKQIAKEEALAYLASTDWYVVRFSETGEPIPEEIKQARADARVAASE